MKGLTLLHGNQYHLNARRTFRPAMTTEDKVKYGMMALGGASIVFTTLGVHISPLAQVTGGWGN
jgi:hypothetical protein